MPLKPSVIASVTVALSTILLPAQGIGLGGSPGGIYGGRASHRTSAAARARRPAIEAGLRWLAKARSEQGFWCEDGADETAPSTVAVTGLAVLAFLADGSTMRSGPHKESIKWGVSWLRTRQSEGGSFSTATGPHLLATLAMVESYRLSNYRLLKTSAQLGVQHLATLRTEDGGWPAAPDADASAPALTVWGAMALGTALDAGLAVPSGAREDVLRWLGGPRADSVPEVDVFGAPVPATRLHEIALEQPIANAFTRCWLAPLDEQQRALSTARERPGTWAPSKDQKLSMVERSFAALLLMQAQEFESLDTLLAGLVEAQVQDGEHAGSWPPIGAHGEVAGRLGTTALALLTLTADKRYAAPIANELPPLEPGDGR